MARSNNLPAKRYKAGERTERKLRFNVDFDGGSPDHDHAVYIDIAQALSVVNQRAYRQGLYYYVSGVTVHNSGDSWVRFSTLPDTWTVKAAWIRGYKLWSEMNRRALLSSQDKTNALYPKYHDFKVFMDDDHVGKASSADDDGNTVITPGNILPSSYAKHGAVSGVALTCDEWAMSMYTAPDPGDHASNNIELPDSFTVMMVGAHETSGETTTVGLIKSYAQTKPPVPDTSGVPNQWSGDSTINDPLFLLFDEGDTHQEIVDDLLSFNDRAPYNYDAPYGMNDDHLNQAAQLTTTAEMTVARAGGFCAPLGLIRVDCDIDDTLEFVLDIAEGPYHGVYAERIL